MRLTDRVSPHFSAIIVGLVLLVVAFAASANPITTKANSKAEAHANSKSTSEANSDSISDSNSGGNSLSVSNRDRLQAPSIAPPAVYASGVCVRGYSAGLSVPGASLGGGKSYPDPECDIREAARVLDGIGAHALALKVACTLAAVKAVASPEDCVYAPPVVATAPPQSPPVAPSAPPPCDCTKAFEKAVQK